MFIVKVGDKISIDRALKILKNKMVKTGVLKELRRRQQFLKKSEVRREEIKNAIYIQALRDEEMKNE
jgi:small subunit ribosomal protein S21